jgi:cytochrome c biogenesis protein CcmG/thiol:disulfide interchange protein DsbE
LVEQLKSVQMIRKSKFIAMALVALALTIGPMPARFESRGNAQVVRASRNIYDFTLRDLDGRETKLSQYRGHPVVIDFWATWCAPCRHQIPELKRLYTKYHKSRGLVVLGVACDTVQGDGVRSIRPFVHEFDISYPVLLAETPVLDDFGIEALPTTVFLGSDGTIVGRVMGAGATGELTESVNALLANPSGKSKPAKKMTPEDEKKDNLYNIEYRR